LKRQAISSQIILKDEGGRNIRTQGNLPLRYEVPPGQGKVKRGIIPVDLACLAFRKLVKGEGEGSEQYKNGETLGGQESSWRRSLRRGLCLFASLGLESIR